MIPPPATSFGFLLGSGVSLPAAPGTQAITDLVLNHSEDYYLHSDGEWYGKPKSEFVAAESARARQSNVQRLIANLSTRVEQYYGARENPLGCPKRLCNYEDVGYLADALAGTLSGNRDDPGLVPLAHQLLQDLRCSMTSLLQIAMDTVDFVRRVVFLSLIDVRPPNNHLQLLIAAARDPEVGSLPVYTLNHDCLLEDSFDAAGIKIFDFRRNDDSGRIRLDLSAAPPSAVPAILYKPHGSVRWRRFRPLRAQAGMDPWSTEWIGWDRDQAGNRHDNGATWRSVGPPIILVGRFNKELDYTEAPYWQTFLAMARSLDNLRQLVVSGYGFADKAINTLLTNWLYGKPMGERRMVIMHNDQTELLGQARGAIRNNWGGWIAHGRLRLIPRFPCDYSWSELRSVLEEIK